jgi:hypothetical protein
MSLIVPIQAQAVAFFYRHKGKFIAAGLVVFLLAVVFIYRACAPKARLNEKEIQAGEQAVKDRNDKELKEILANVDARESQIDVNVANAEAATEKAKEEAKKKYEGMTVDELAAELERRK